MKEDLDLLIWIGIFVALLVLSLMCVGWTIYALAKYGSYPINEVPSWALWFMFKHK